MRVLLVNWSNVWEGASRGGGVNGYLQSLALELARAGHDVCSLSGGWVYAPGSALQSGPGPCTIRRHADWHSVRCFEVINSPVVAPGIFQFDDPLGEVAAPDLEREITRFYHLLEPDIVHFHNIEGFSAGCVDAARTPSATWPGARVLFSLHNYHTICPQVYLMRGGRVACTDSDNGHACADCTRSPRDPGEERRIRASEYDKGVPDDAARETTEARAGLLGLSWGKIKRPIEVPLPGQPAATREDVAVRGHAVPPPPVALPVLNPSDPSWSPLENNAGADPRNSRPLHPFGKRRRAMIEMLSRCSRVIAVSSFVHRKFEAMGVRREALRTLPIGTRMTEVAAASPELLFDPPPFDPPRPIRIVFLGYNNFYKGLPMLCDALELLDRATLGRLHLHVYAKDIAAAAPRLVHLESRLAALTTRGEYTPEQIPALLSGKDLGLVPSVWWDNGPQTVLEFLACRLPVLGAALGGIPDMITHGENGLLHRGNDRHDLATKLREVVANPSILAMLRANIKPPPTMGEHAAKMSELYAECVADGA